MTPCINQLEITNAVKILRAAATLIANCFIHHPMGLRDIVEMSICSLSLVFCAMPPPELLTASTGGLVDGG